MFLIGEVCGASRKASSNNEPTEVSRCHSSQRLKARGRRRSARRNYAIRGWVNYFRLTEMRNFLRETDEWLRSRIRMCIWKCWKRVRTRFKNLQRCGIVKWQAWQWANTRKGYWRTVHSPILTRAISNENLKRAHYPTLTEYYEKMHPR